MYSRPGTSSKYSSEARSHGNRGSKSGVTRRVENVWRSGYLYQKGSQPLIKDYEISSQNIYFAIL